MSVVDFDEISHCYDMSVKTVIKGLAINLGSQELMVCVTWMLRLLLWAKGTLEWMVCSQLPQREFQCESS